MKRDEVSNFMSNMPTIGLEYPEEMTLEDIFYNFNSKERRSYAFVEMNIKNFQYFNARYGRQYGDEILERVDKILVEFLKNRGYIRKREGDTYHFFIYCPYSEELDESRDDYVCSEFLIDLTDRLFFNDMKQIDQNIYTSFGIVLPEDLNEDYHELVVKTSVIRKNCLELKKRSYSFEVYTEDKFKKYLNRHDMIHRITEARMNDEFIIYVQPKVNIHTEKIVGGEVLLRWPDSGGISLYECFSVLNELGEIYSLDLYNFKKVCHYLKEGLDKGEKRVPMSFNVPNITVTDIDFKKDYMTNAEEIGVPKEYVEFEFLEDIQFKDGDDIKETIRMFKEEGFHCSLDDFGAGNASFSVLFKGYIDVIKLDRIFFRDAITEQRKQIIENVIQLAKSLHVKVVAEGVEDKEYIDFLKTTDCQVVQGFYYYHPMPLEEFQKLLNEQYS